MKIRDLGKLNICHAVVVLYVDMFVGQGGFSVTNWGVLNIFELTAIVAKKSLLLKIHRLDNDWAKVNLSVG